MIKNVIFDIGNVILDYNPMNYLFKNFGVELSIELFTKIFKSKEWLELDRGTIDNRLAAEKIAQGEESLTFDLILKILENWSDESFKQIDSTVEFIKYLKKTENYKLYLLSNIHEKAFLESKKKYEILSYFDGAVVSYKCHMLKPEEEIYKLLLKNYKLKVEECAFLDDTLQNVVKANSLGIRSVHYQNMMSLCEFFNIIKA